MKSCKPLRVSDFAVAILLITSIMALVLIFTGYLPSIGLMPVRNSDRIVLESAQAMAVRGSIAAAVAAVGATLSLTGLWVRFRKRRDSSKD